MSDARKRSPFVTPQTIAATLPPDSSSLSTVRTWIGDGRLPSVKIGKRRLVKRADAAAFLGIGPDDFVEDENG